LRPCCLTAAAKRRSSEGSHRRLLVSGLKLRCHLIRQQVANRPPPTSFATSSHCIPPSTQPRLTELSSLLPLSPLQTSLSRLSNQSVLRLQTRLSRLSKQSPLPLQTNLSRLSKPASLASASQSLSPLQTNLSCLSNSLSLACPSQEASPQPPFHPRRVATTPTPRSTRTAQPRCLSCLSIQVEARDYVSVNTDNWCTSTFTSASPAKTINLCFVTT
jgi:hypothetical protein